MFNLETAKEIIIKPNNDKTFNVIIKYDFYDSESKQIIQDVEITYYRAKVKLDIEVLAEDDTYGEVIVKNEQSPLKI